MTNTNDNENSGSFPAEVIVAESRDFLLRNVPGDIHRRWKTISAYLGKGMGDFAVEAIETYVSAMEVKHLTHPFERNVLDGEQ